MGAGRALPPPPSAHGERRRGRAGTSGPPAWLGRGGAGGRWKAADKGACPPPPPPVSISAPRTLTASGAAPGACSHQQQEQEPGKGLPKKKKIKSILFKKNKTRAHCHPPTHRCRTGLAPQSKIPDLSPFPKAAVPPARHRTPRSRGRSLCKSRPRGEFMGNHEERQGGCAGSRWGPCSHCSPGAPRRVTAHGLAPSPLQPCCPHLPVAGCPPEKGAWGD